MRVRNEKGGRGLARRRAAGWLLSALILLAYYSPQSAMLRALPDTLVVARGQHAAIDAAFPLSVKYDAVAGGADAASAGLGDTLQSVGMSASDSAKATISLFGLLPLREVEIDIRDDLRLWPGGQAVGVALVTDGVLVVGTSDLTGAHSPARLAGLKPGDLITQAAGRKLESTAQLTKLVDASGGATLPITVRRGESTLRLTLEPMRDSQSGAYRIGAWVRDSTAGVGTLSFYGEVDEGEGDCYGALGHAITDADTQRLLTVSRGEIMLSDVVDVRKGAVGAPGELKGSFLREHRVLGGIRLNNQYGIYGDMTQMPAHPLYPDGLAIGRRDAVHPGKASILCTVGPEGMREYDVEIVEVARQSAPAQRSMILRVTDERLLERTGGIVQGMSGSPILQDGRLIGAVTHVFVNDPTMGYGLFIEWMLAQ